MGTDAEIIKDDVKEAHILQKQLMSLLPEGLKKGTSGEGNKSRRKSKAQRGGNALNNAKDLSTIATSLIMIYRKKSGEAINGFIEKYGSDGLKTRIISAGKDAEMFLKKQKGGTSASRSRSRSGSGSRSRSGSGSRSRSGSRSESEKDSFVESDESENVNVNVYTGEKNEKGEKHGTGKMEYANGDVYDGQWKGNLRHGNGKITFLNKSTYEGTWSKDQITGKGIYTYFNGDIYEGALDKGVRTGFGKMTFQNGDVYEGSWKKNRREGEGKLHYKNGDNFVGHWHKDMRDGEGRLTDAIGKVLEEGEYEDDSPPFDIKSSASKIQSFKENVVGFLGKTSTHIEDVVSSENHKKFQAAITKVKESLPSMPNLPELEKVSKYSAAIIAIFQTVEIIIFGNCTFKDDAKSNLLCTTIKGLLEIMQSTIKSSADTANVGLKQSGKIAIAAFKTSMDWFFPVFLGIAAAGTAGFLVLLLYGAFIYLNSKHEDREKLNKTRRRHK
jgi:hypothetical protein